MLLDQAIHELDDTLASRHGLLERLGALRAVLLAEPVRSGDGWLDARARRADRDRCRLATRLAAAAQRLRERPGAGLPAQEVRRLRTDLEHYRQRVHDLAYDTVGMELGGSE